MARFEKSISINAPVEQVFNFMDNPHNLPGVWPNMSGVKDVEKLPNGGVCYSYHYKLAGITLESKSEDVEHVQNVRTVSKSSGGADSTVTVDFEPVGARTKVTVTGDYTVPLPLIGKLAESLLARTVEHDAENLLVNLKARMEG